MALLRGINVSGQHGIPMAELRSLCSELGCADVRTYIQSGNIVFTATAAPSTLERRLERAIEQRFGFSVPTLVRSSTRWRDYVKNNPFPDVSERTPNLVLLALSKAPPKAGAEDGLRERAAQGERVVRVGDALWIYCPAGIGRSKLSPVVLDRLVGSPVTARNWRTTTRLDRMVRQSSPAAW